MALAALLGCGAVLVLTFVHFSRDSRDAEPAQRSQQAAGITSPFSAPTNSKPMVVATADEIAAPRATATFDSPAVTRRRPESDADPADLPTRPEDFPTYDESSVELTDEQRLPAEESGAADANARAAALREIDTASPDSFTLLEQTLRSDSTARNRLLAVNSLRLLGKQAGNIERAREALRRAMSDADANVRTSAQDAYQELSR